MKKSGTTASKVEAIALTPRQQQILSLIWEGQTTTEIAKELKVSARTIEVHRFHMMKKFRVTNLAQLLRAGLEQGLITLHRR